MDHSRRNFIKVSSFATLSVLPALTKLSALLGIEAQQLIAFDGIQSADYEFHFVDTNLLNLHFYFINIVRKGNRLKPKEDKPAYMIIRLPQMHISEKGFWDSDWIGDTKPNPEGRMSGYSYLAFEMWPGTRKEDLKDRTFNFLLEDLLNWNSKYFNLITLVEWFDLKKVDSRAFNYVHYGKDACTEFEKAKTLKETGLLEAGLEQSTSLIFQKYKGIVGKLFSRNVDSKNNDFVPVTFFEVPQGICLVPISRDGNGKLAPLRKRFWKNETKSLDTVKEGERTYEVWNNTFNYFQKADTKKPEESKSFEIQTPSFRIAGLIGTSVQCPVPSTACDNMNGGNFLPSLLDKTELAFLTQFANGEIKNSVAQKHLDHTKKDFDIRELNGFFFTGLGAITHLKYYNLDYKPNGIDLIEYEHVINQGRDLFVKVARLGYNSKTGQRYKHVIEGKRIVNTETGVNKPPLASFIQLKQYCECIDKHIVYNGAEKPMADSMSYCYYNDKTGLKSSWLDRINHNVCDYKMLSFTDLTVIEKERIPINCLENIKIETPDISRLQYIKWFWPVQESRTKPGQTDSEIPADDYLQCEFEATDWEGKKISAKTPFMFIRESALVNGNNLNFTFDANGIITSGEIKNAYANYYKNGNNGSKIEPVIERRKTYLHSQVIALTPDPKQTITESLIYQKEKALLKKDLVQKAQLDARLLNLDAEESDKPKTKINLVEADFIEHYFNIRNITKQLSDNKLIGEIPYLIYPQLLRAKVYTDHIKEMTFTKIPSIIEYHPDFIKYFHNDYKIVDDKINKGKKIVEGNGSRLIYRHTEAYLNEFEEKINSTKTQVEASLQGAKQKMGNMVTLDFLPETFGFNEMSITAPADLKKKILQGRVVLDKVEGGFEKLKAFNPMEILRGKLSNICGLDLTQILDELLPAANEISNATPLFKFQKIINQLEGEVLNSPIYKKITSFTINYKGKEFPPEKLIEELESDIAKYTGDLNNALNNVTRLQKQLNELIPNTSELSLLAKNLLEVYKTRAANLVLSELDKQVKTFIGYVNDEITILKSECSTSVLKGVENELIKLQADAKNTEKSIIKELKEKKLHLLEEQVGIILGVIRSYKPETLQADFDAIVKKVADNHVPTELKNVYYNINTLKISNATGKDMVKLAVIKDITSTGLVQIESKTRELQTIIAANINGTDLQKSTTSVLQKTLKDYNARLKTLTEQFETFSIEKAGEFNNHKVHFDKLIEAVGLTTATKANIRALFSFAEKVTPYLDYFRKTTPYFYYSQQKRLQKEVADIEKRFKQDFFEKYNYHKETVQELTKNYNEQIRAYAAALKETVGETIALDDLKKIRTDYLNYSKAISESANNLPDAILSDLKETEAYKDAWNIYSKMLEFRDEWLKAEEELRNADKLFKKILQQQAGDLAGKIDTQITAFIKEKEQELLGESSQDIIKQIEDEVRQANKIYKLITSVKQQELSYKWHTEDFRDMNLGIVSFKKFSNPNTSLKADVKTVVHFNPAKFPPVIDKVTSYAENRFTNFGVTFFNSLTVNFNEVSFIAGTERSTKFDVKIKNVQFGGALSFVQAFEEWLRTMGKGLILLLRADHVALGYSLPIPNITTPAFSFFNLSLNLDLRIYFDQTPMSVGFSLAKPESKFGISAGIYAGFGFFSVVANTKKGIVEIDCALEAGAWSGIRIGPIRGEVKLAFGFRYTKNAVGVRLEGYIVAEGTLSVWILEVSARIYLGVVSQNSYVEGRCTVTYSAKLGLIRRSFSGTFYRKIAGAEKKNTHETAELIEDYYKLFTLEKVPMNKDFQKEYIDFLESEDEMEEETYSVSEKEWEEFITIF